MSALLAAALAARTVDKERSANVKERSLLWEVADIFLRDFLDNTREILNDLMLRFAIASSVNVPGRLRIALERERWRHKYTFLFRVPS